MLKYDRAPDIYPAAAETIVSCVSLDIQPQDVFHRLKAWRLYLVLLKKLMPELGSLTPKMTCDVVAAIAKAGQKEFQFAVHVEAAVEQRPFKFHAEHLISMLRDFASLQQPCAKMRRLLLKREHELPECTPSALCALPAALAGHRSGDEGQVEQRMLEIISDLLCKPGAYRLPTDGRVFRSKAPLTELLPMCSVYSAVSGEPLAVLETYDGISAKEMKRSLQIQIGVPPFRQKFFLEDGSQEIQDDEVFAEQPVKIKLVLSDFWPPDFEEDRRMMAACRNNDSVRLEKLLKCPRNPNFRDVNGDMPLHRAAAAGHIKPTLLLLEAGALKDARDKEGQGVTPLFIAAGNGHAEVVSLLIEKGADKSKTRTFDGATPLHIATQRGHLQVVHLLVKLGVEIEEATTNTGATPLHIAVENAHLEVMYFLIEAGADINKATTVDGATPLYIAALNGHVKVVRLLIQAGADRNKARTRDGATPVYIACLVGHLNVVQVLVEAGVDIDQATTETGATPLYVAAQECRTKIACLLVEAGVDINKARAIDGATPLYVAAQSGHLQIVKLLVKAGVDIDKATSKTGTTPLHIATKRCHIAVVRLLIDSGADIHRARTDDFWWEQMRQRHFRLRRRAKDCGSAVPIAEEEEPLEGPPAVVHVSREECVQLVAGCAKLDFRHEALLKGVTSWLCEGRRHAELSADEVAAFLDSFAQLGYAEPLLRAALEHALLRVAPEMPPESCTRALQGAVDVGMSVRGTAVRSLLRRCGSRLKQLPEDDAEKLRHLLFHPRALQKDHPAMDISERLQPVQPVPVPAELTQLAAASVQDEWCQLLILREQVARREKQATYWQHLRTLAQAKERCVQCDMGLMGLQTVLVALHQLCQLLMDSEESDFVSETLAALAEILALAAEELPREGSATFPVLQFQLQELAEYLGEVNLVPRGHRPRLGGATAGKEEDSSLGLA
eukprot:s631_g16.t2